MRTSSRLKTQTARLASSLACCVGLAALLAGCAAPPAPVPTPTPTPQNTFLPAVPAPGAATATPLNTFLPAIPAAEPTP